MVRSVAQPGTNSANAHLNRAEPEKPIKQSRDPLLNQKKKNHEKLRFTRQHQPLH